MLKLETENDFTIHPNVLKTKCSKIKCQKMLNFIPKMILYQNTAKYSLKKCTKLKCS
jgi:hypothetical protein